MVRFILFLVIIYVAYAVYRKIQNPQIEFEVNGSGNGKTFSKIYCPSPKTFIDYTEGRIKGKNKKAIDSHIANCADCQDALKDVFGMSGKSDQKSELERTK